FVAEQQTPGTFNDGRRHDYGLGLMIGTYRGVNRVQLSGSTAGYRAHLVRYPDQRVSIAVLCNVSSGNATQAAHGVADLYLGDRAKTPSPPAATYTLTDADLSRMAGLYRNKTTGVPLTVGRRGSALVLERGASDGLNATSGQAFA